MVPASELLARWQKVIEMATPTGWIVARPVPFRLGGIKHLLDAST